MSAAFEGLRVLDLSAGVAGAMCTRWFAGFGAEVIRVEPPGGTPLRSLGPFAGNAPGPETGAAFLHLDGGKKSITLDLETAEGQALLTRLAAVSALLVEDTAPGTMESRGLGFTELSAANPGLVYLSLTPFGQTGPYRDYPATDLTLAAFSGTMSDRTLAGRNPVRMGGSQGWYIAGRVAFIAAAAALLHYAGTGEGQHIDLSLLEPIAGNDMAAPTTYSYHGLVHGLRRQPSARGRGGQGRYPCADGWVDVMPGVGGLKKLAAMLGDPALAEHELFTDHALRARRADEFDAEFMTPWFETRTRSEIVEAGQAVGMPFSCTLTLADLVDEPQLAARGYFARVEHPVAGEVLQPGAPARLEDSPWTSGPAPLLGSANRELLGDVLGLRDDQVARLRELGAV